jgi:hypothetical protein
MHQTELLNLRLLVNRRGVLSLRKVKNENVKADTAWKITSARQERPKTTTHEFPKWELCK